jgi:hypothetical protein
MTIHYLEGYNGVHELVGQIVSIWRDGSHLYTGYVFDFARNGTSISLRLDDGTYMRASVEKNEIWQVP